MLELELADFARRLPPVLTDNFLFRDTWLGSGAFKRSRIDTTSFLSPKEAHYYGDYLANGLFWLWALCRLRLRHDFFGN